MQADFSRRTFAAANHFSSVLAQQGRVGLDADLNEQAAILLHLVRTAVADIIGPAAAPAGPAAGFAIEAVLDEKTNKVADLRISPGRMYIDGILVEAEDHTTYWNQPDGHLDSGADQLPADNPFLVYLRVWERLITSVQQPLVREVALGDPGPDTSARSKVIWQVATLPQPPGGTDRFEDFLGKVTPTGVLAARAKRPSDSDQQPCELPPEAEFRGPENQLYRVEIHSGGQPDSGNTRADSFRGPTFKWSRENASVVLPIVSVSGAVVEVTTLGRDGKLAVEVGDWVELVDDASASRVADDLDLSDGNVSRSTPLRRVVAVDPAARLVTVDTEADRDGCGPGTRSDLHPLLRRWDHHSPTTIGTARLEIADDGALPIVKGEWIDLEDGVQVLFDAGTYRRGDHWLIPARVVTGDVEWPQDKDGPARKAPDGVEYHYAPLAMIAPDGSASAPRPTFDPVTATPTVPPTTRRRTPSKAKSDE